MGEVRVGLPLAQLTQYDETPGASMEGERSVG